MLSVLGGRQRCVCDEQRAKRITELSLISFDECFLLFARNSSMPKVQPRERQLSRLQARVGESQKTSAFTRDHLTTHCKHRIERRARLKLLLLPSRMTEVYLKYFLCPET